MPNHTTNQTSSLNEYCFVYDSTGAEIRLNLPSDEAAFAKQAELSESCDGTGGVLLFRVVDGDLFFYAHNGNAQGLTTGWYDTGRRA